MVSYAFLPDSSKTLDATSSFYAKNKTQDVLLIEFIHCQKDYKKNLNLRIMIKPFIFHLCLIFNVEYISIFLFEKALN